MAGPKGIKARQDIVRALAQGARTIQGVADAVDYLFEVSPYLSAMVREHQPLIYRVRRGEYALTTHGQRYWASLQATSLSNPV
jgi:hypothetical protein